MTVGGGYIFEEQMLWSVCDRPDSFRRKDALMFDFREHKDVIRDAVKRADKDCEFWKWSVKAVNKSEVKIAWSYLSDNELFTVVVDDTEPDDIFFVGEAPHGAFRAFANVADNRWADAKTVDDGIAVVIAKLTRAAERRY